LFQGFLICGALEIQTLAFNYLPFIGFQGQFMYLINFLVTWISIFNNTMTAIVILSFNGDVRRWLKEMRGLGPKSSLMLYPRSGTSQPTT
jgi:hypothetical protein